MRKLSNRGIFWIGLMLCYILFFVLLLTCCGSKERETALQEKREKKWDKIKDKESIEAIKSLRYIKDLRTGLCFAHIPEYRSSVMANVPCERIPKHIIIKVNGGLK